MEWFMQHSENSFDGTEIYLIMAWLSLNFNKNNFFFNLLIEGGTDAIALSIFLTKLSNDLDGLGTLMANWGKHFWRTY